MNEFLLAGLGEMLCICPDPFLNQALAASADGSITRILDIYGGFSAWLSRNATFLLGYDVQPTTRLKCSSLERGGSGQSRLENGQLSATQLEYFAVVPAIEEPTVKVLRRKKSNIFYFCANYEELRLQRSLFDFQHFSVGALTKLTNPVNFFIHTCLNSASGGRLLVRYPCFEWLQKMAIAGTAEEQRRFSWCHPLHFSRILEETGFAHVVFWRKTKLLTADLYTAASDYCRSIIESEPEIDINIGDTSSDIRDKASGSGIRDKASGSGIRDKASSSDIRDKASGSGIRDKASSSGIRDKASSSGIRDKASSSGIRDRSSGFGMEGINLTGNASSMRKNLATAAYNYFTNESIRPAEMDYIELLAVKGLSSVK